MPTQTLFFTALTSEDNHYIMWCKTRAMECKRQIYRDTERDRDREGVCVRKRVRGRRWREDRRERRKGREPRTERERSR